MRTVWNTTSFIAIVNLLALGMFVGWLFQSGRLNEDRVDQVRQIFTTTVAEDQATADADAAAAEAAQAAADEQTRLEATPLTAERQILLTNRFDEQEHMVTDRLDEYRNQLAQKIAADQATLERERAAFEAEKLGWEAAVEAERKRKTDEQFGKAVKLLEALPPKQGKQKIEALVAGGDTEQAVAYLDAMNPRAKSKLFREFKTVVENELATDLLERLRTFGLGSLEAEDASNDASPPGSDPTA